MTHLRWLVFVAVAVAALVVAPTTAQEYRETDIREANVMGVQWEGAAGEYRFDVTLYHDDAGEDGYADWWQVETLDGERLGRRTLAHPHGTQEFTRSAEVTVPSDVETVVVRGHDQTHGYGGTAVLVYLGNGTARAVDQGSEPWSFGGDGGGATAEETDGTEGDGAEPSDAGVATDGRSTDDGDDGPDSVDGQDPSDVQDPSGGEGLPGFGPTAAVAAIAGSVLLRRN